MTRATAALIALIAVLAWPAAASAQPSAQRKQAPDKFVRAAGEAFVAAVTADKQGDLPVALGLYQRAFAIAPHPSTVYNMADVQRRLGQLIEAVLSYETYLAIAPAAADRAAVAAVIDRLVRTPGVMFLATARASDPKSVDLVNAYILVDGVIVSRPGAVLSDHPNGGLRGLAVELAPGPHDVDIVTAITYGHTTCRVDPGTHKHCYVTAEPRTDGNLVVSGIDRNMQVLSDHRDRRNASRMRTRFAADKGRVTLAVRDGQHECPPLTLDSPAGDHVSYAFLSTTEPSTYARCRTLDVRRQRLVFKP